MVGVANATTTTSAMNSVGVHHVALRARPTATGNTDRPSAQSFVGSWVCVDDVAPLPSSWMFLYVLQEQLFLYLLQRALLH